MHALRALCTVDNHPDRPTRLSAGAAAALGAPDTPLAKAVRILNNQLQALTTIETRTGELEGRLGQLDVAA